MKSPQISTIVIAIAFALIAYFIVINISATPTIIALIVFISAFVAPLISNVIPSSISSNSTTSSNDNVRTLYVGNLPYRANESAVKDLFAEYGSVESVRLMKDKHTGKRRGFGFVEMDANDIDKAISALNDTEFQQRTLKVREAKERPERTDNDDS